MLKTSDQGVFVVVLKCEQRLLGIVVWSPIRQERTPDSGIGPTKQGFWSVISAILFAMHRPMPTMLSVRLTHPCLAPPARLRCRKVRPTRRQLRGASSRRNTDFLGGYRYGSFNSTSSDSMRGTTPAMSHRYHLHRYPSEVLSHGMITTKQKWITEQTQTLK